MSKSSDKRQITVPLPDDVANLVSQATEAGLDDVMRIADWRQSHIERRTEAGLRKGIAISLWAAGTIVLGSSLVLIFGQALGWSKLPDAAITTLIGSVAAEFIAMFFVVVRYLFPHGGGRGHSG